MIYDGLVIGGGFYGASIARYLVRSRGFRQVAVVEMEDKLLSRASYVNQARVHGGYHYPRSFTTAYRSSKSITRFYDDYREAVRQDFKMVYAIPRRNSKVSPRQFERFCKAVDAPLEKIELDQARFFDPRLIEACYGAREYAFDASVLRARCVMELAQCNVDVYLGTRVVAVSDDASMHRVLTNSEVAGERSHLARHVFNCTYSGLAVRLAKEAGVPLHERLKHEIVEIALYEMPEELSSLGITIMDGAFFSCMPFPARPGLHSLTHVRYTPHMEFRSSDADFRSVLSEYQGGSRADRMFRDAVRYMPKLRGARYAGSLFDTKTVLLSNETDDGRPILFHRNMEMPSYYLVMGGKIDNIYDVTDRLDQESFDLS